MINMIEPTDPAERAAAIRVCRLNAWLNPDTGLTEPDPEVIRKLWNSKGNDVTFSKWIWMWNHAKDEWDMRPRPDSEGGQHG